MARSRNGSGRHRQVMILVTCPDCQGSVQVPRPTKSRPLRIKTHFDADGFLCPPYTPGSAPVVPPGARKPEWAGQGTLFEVA